MKATVEVDVDGRRLTLSNLDKVMYPQSGFTKGQVIDYYTRVAPVLLPHLTSRPLTLKRYPDGVEGQHFYEKQCPKHRPDWVRTAPIRLRRGERTVNFCVVDELPTLVWTANLADLELHTSLSLADDGGQPTVLVFDLDPGVPATIVECARVGAWLRAIFDELGMESFPKTSGSKGLQVYVPLNTPVEYEATKRFARALAELLERQHSELVVSSMKKSLRGGRVFVDWSQNADHKTTVCVYSLRARERPTVSTPLAWDEVHELIERGDPEAVAFDSDQVLSRIERHGDRFAPVARLEQRLPEL